MSASCLWASFQVASTLSICSSHSQLLSSSVLMLPGHELPCLPTCHSDDHHAYILRHTHTFYFFPTFHLSIWHLHSRKASEGPTFLYRPTFHHELCRIRLNCLCLHPTSVLDTRTRWSRFDPRQRQRIFLLASASRPALGPTFPPIHWVMGTGGPFPGSKARQGRDADHSPPSRAEVENE
jgi:hypothetical protein